MAKSPAPLGGKKAMLPPQASEGVPYGKLFKWGWRVVSVAKGWFVANTLLSIGVLALTQFNVQVLATVVSALGSSGRAAAPEGTSAGILTALLPRAAETAAIVFAALAVTLILLQFLERLLSSWTDNVMLGRLQQRLHDKLMVLGPGYHRSHDIGETSLIVLQYATGAQVLLRDLISYPVVRGIGLATALVFLFHNLHVIGDAPLWIRLLLLAALIAFPFLGWWLSTRLRAAFKLVTEAQTAVANEFQNSAQLPQEVQLMGAESQRSRDFGARLQRLIRAKVAAAVRNEAANQFQNAMPLFLQTIFLIYGVFFALRSGAPESAGAILAIYYFVPQVINPVQEILQFVLGLNSTWPQVERVVEVLETEPEIEDAFGSVALSDEDRAVTLEEVSFTYLAGGRPVLDHVSHRFAPGEITAIVARAGGGKSTLLNLVARLRRVSAGRLLIGTKDVTAVTRDSLRRKVVKVSQFPLFLADTMRANFQLARADATDAEIEEVCRMTGIWQVLVDLAPGLPSPLDYHLPRALAEGPSGGQRRLLAVTRALLLEPSILMLDEPTTGIDALGRQMLADLVKRVCSNITVLLVDHDMDFVAQVADVVCCLEDGRFTAVGSPQELLANDTLFRALTLAPHASPGFPASDPASCRPSAVEGPPTAAVGTTIGAWPEGEKDKKMTVK
jgi:ATP-binding cassette subfamily B protein